MSEGETMSPMTMEDAAKIKLLIVDDQERVRQDLRTALQLMQGLEVVGEAADGFEAVQQAEVLGPDVVLMDLKMPGMDGFEAARQIKARRLARGVVALTIYGDDLAREQAIRVGMDAFVEKGTPIQTLAETIRKVRSIVL
jgi:DNA-binding NarL/FixJ family response regulator